MDLLKNLIYAGVGLASLAADKLQATVNDLVKKGKISDEEGKRIIQEFFENSDAKKEEFENKFKAATENIIDRFEFARKKDLVELQKRVEDLEAELAKMNEGDSKKVTTKKVTTKKKEGDDTEKK